MDGAVPIEAERSMLINADFDQLVIEHNAPESWVESPAKGVTRRMLDRVGGEVARATSLVRYAPLSAFATHTHELGEEYLVLEGSFLDEEGHHPVGTYVRNPPGSKHSPGSVDGCVIFVKLRQFQTDDRKYVNKMPKDQIWERADYSDAVEYKHLYEDLHESVRIERWKDGYLSHEFLPFGAELLVISGALTLQTAGKNEQLLPWSWMRLPEGATLGLSVGGQSACVWIKRHLQPLAPPPP